MPKPKRSAKLRGRDTRGAQMYLRNLANADESFVPAYRDIAYNDELLEDYYEQSAPKKSIEEKEDSIFTDKMLKLIRERGIKDAALYETLKIGGGEESGYLQSLWNLFNLSRVKTMLTSDLERLREANMELDALNKIEEYATLLDEVPKLIELQKLLSEYDQTEMEKSGYENVDIESALAENAKRSREVNSKIQELQKFFKTDGRKYDSVLRTFYDLNKTTPDIMGEMWRENLLDLQGFKNLQEGEYAWYNPVDWFKATGNALSGLLGTTGDLVETGVQGLSKLIPWEDSYGNFSYKAIKKSDPKNRTYDLLFDNHMTVDGTDGGEFSIRTSDLHNNYKKWKDYYTRNVREQEEEVKDTQNAIKNGGHFLGVLPYTTQNINSIVENSLKETPDTFWGSVAHSLNPANVAEGLGSSWSDTQNLLSATAADFAAGRASSLISKRFPKFFKATNKAFAFATQALNIWFTSRMRENETASESMDALSSRIFHEAQEQGIDLVPVLKSTEDYAKTMGIDTSEMDELELLLLALAYNVQSDDKRYNDILTDALRGIRYLQNQNNALAVADYFERFPFMDYSRSALKSLVSREGRAAGLTGREFGTIYLDNRKYLQSSGMQRMLTDETFAKSVDASVTAVLDRAITRASKKIFKNDVASQIKMQRIGNFVANKIGTLGGVGISEGIEEGVQNLLLSRYERGEYDDYNRPYTIFNPADLFDNVNIASSAIGDYFGINWGDPDNGDAELRKAINSGIVTGAISPLLGAGPHGIFSNILPNKFYGDVTPSNLKNLIYQLKNDNILKSLIGQNYGVKQDDDHVGIFYDYFMQREKFNQKAITPLRLEESLNALKQNKGDFVSDEYIDRDIELMHKAYSVYNNHSTDNLLDAIHVTRNSEDHKNFVKLAVKTLSDYDDIRKKSDANNKEYDKFVNNTINQILYEDENSDPVIMALRKAIENQYNDHKKLFEANQDAERKKKADAIRNAVATEIAQREGQISAEPTEQEVLDEIDKRLGQREEFLSKEDYTRQIIDNLLNYNRLQNAKRLLKDITRQKDALTIIKNLTGVDLDTQRLGGTLDYLRSIIQHSEKLLNKNLSEINKIVDERNTILTEANKILEAEGKEQRYELEKHRTIEDLFKDFGPFKDQELLDKLLQIDLLNSAARSMITPFVDIYTMGVVNPTQLYRAFRTPTWGDLSKEQRNEYIEKTRQEYEREGKKFSKDEARRKYIRERNEKIKFVENADIDAVMKDAAQAVVANQLLEKKTKLAKAREEYDQSMPVTTVDLANAELGNERAQQKVEAHAEEQFDENDILGSLERMQVHDPNQSVQLQEPEYELLDALTGDVSDEAEKNLELTLSGGSNESYKAKQERLQKLANQQEAQQENESSEDDETAVDEIESLGEENIPEEQEVLPTTEEINAALVPEESVTDSETTENIQEQETEEEQVLEEEQTPEEAAEQAAEAENENKVDPEDITDNGTTNPDTGKVVDTRPVETEQDSESTEDGDGNNGRTQEEDQEEINEKNEEPSMDPVEILETSSESLSLADMFDEMDINDLLSVSEENLDLLELDTSLSIWDVNSGMYDSDAKKDTNSSEKALGNYLSSTFFYQPTSDTPMKLSVNRSELKTKYKVRSGKELSQRLSEKGWVESCDIYYVVSGNTEVRGNLDPNNFTVSLVIDDNKNKATYLCTLRTPAVYEYIDPTTGKVKEEDGESKIRETLRYIGVNRGKLESEYDEQGNILRKSYKSFLKDYNKAIQEIREAKYVKEHPNDNIPVRLNYRSDKAYEDALNDFYHRAKDWYEKMKPSDPVRREIMDEARKRFLKKGSRILTEAEIDKQIEDLKTQRNAIINAYCSKTSDGKYEIPTTIHNRVRPVTINISNGKINVKTILDKNSVDYGLPEFHSLVGDEGFGLSSDIEELTKQLSGQNPEAQFVYGLGVFGEPQFGTILINGNSISTYEREDLGKGLAGKIYFVATAANGKKVPVMLHEQTFKKQHSTDGKSRNLLFNRTDKNTGQKKSNVTLAIDPKTGTYVPGDYYPSAAEVILYLVTGRLSTANFPYSGLTRDYNTKSLMEEFLRLFCNTGKTTDRTVKSNGKRANQKTLNALSYYVAKTLNFVIDEKTNLALLYVGDKDNNGNSIVKGYTLDQLFGEGSEETRARVVTNIAQNMHWNTDKLDMNDEFPLTIKKFLKQFFEENPNATEFKLCGIDEFTFKKDDFFKQEDNKLVDKKISVLAWMLKNLKLESDVDKLIFVDPFVFAEGVLSTDAQKAVNDIKENQIDSSKDAPVSVITAGAQTQAKQEAAEQAAAEIRTSEEQRFEPGKIEKITQRIKAKAFDILKLFLKTKELRDGALEGKDILDVIVLDAPPTSNVEEFKKNAMNAVQKYIDHINKSLPANQKYDTSKIDFLNIEQQIRLFAPDYQGKSTLVPTLSFKKDGKGLIRLASPTDLQRMRLVTGVFSQAQQKGKINEKKARKWIIKTLGLKEDQVIVTDAIMRSTENKQVFGLTNLALDRLNGDTFGYFVLSSRAGRGIAYHEAFHYVNLLLHSPEQRMAIYKAYVEMHPEFKKKTFGEIEEAIAEEFREYMEIHNEFSVSNLFKRIYRNFKDLISASRNKNAMQYVFDSIRKGKYQQYSHMDKQSIKEFEKRYPNGVESANYVVPGVSQKVLDKMETITDYHTFYQCAESLAHYFLETFAIRTVADLRSLNKLKKDGTDLLDLLFESLQTENEYEIDDLRKSLVEDIVKNRNAFKYSITRILKQYGLDPKWSKKKEQEKIDTTNKLVLEDETVERDTGARHDMIFEVDHIGISKKDNVAFKAKLFMSQVKMGRFELVDRVETGEDGKQVVVRDRQLIYDTDELLGLPKYYSFGEAWNKILDNLWQCESYNDKDSKTGKYSDTSLLGTVERLSKSDAFFKSLLKSLELVEDLQLLNLILPTIKSCKTQLAYIQLSDKKLLNYTFNDADIDDYMSRQNSSSVADRNRVLQIFNDNSVRAVKQLPRTWGKSAMLSGMIVVKDGTNVVSKKYATMLNDKLNGILDYFTNKDNDPKNAEEYERAYRTVAEKVIDLLNYMSIPVDDAVLDYFVDLHIEDDKLLDDPQTRYNTLKNIMQSTAVGSIGAIIGKKSSGKQTGSQNSKYNSSISHLANVEATEIKFGKDDRKGIDSIYTGYKKTKNGKEPDINLLAYAYNRIHPSSAEFSVQRPDGTMGYPISENNSLSDDIRKLNFNEDGFIDEYKKSPYAKHSYLLRVAENYAKTINATENGFKLNCFTGMKDTRSNSGEDYFGITQMEDYVSKMMMTFNDMLILPTMADKKTWYGISHPNMTTVHDAMTLSESRFSNDTLNTFAGYFEDELSSLEQYFNRDNISYLKNHQKNLLKNFHGKFGKNGRMDLSGNGGKFRYFYDIQFYTNLGYDDSKGNLRSFNLNQLIEFYWNVQKQIEANPEQYGGTMDLYEDGQNELDGFELIRKFLKELREHYSEKDENDNPIVLFNDINNMLILRTYLEMEELSKEGNLQMLIKDINGRYLPYAIPSQILEYYAKELATTGKHKTLYKPYRGSKTDPDLALSAIGSHVASTMMSIIEIEKVFAGDPAYYKSQNIKTINEAGEIVDLTEDVMQRVSYGGKKYEFSCPVTFLQDKSDDKIKRLGALLSPGTDIRTQYDPSELKMFSEKYGVDLDFLLKDTYTNLNMSDAIAMSTYLEESKDQFERQALVNIILTKNPDWFNKYVKEKYNGNKNAAINDIYLSRKKYESLLAIAPTNVQNEVKFVAKLSAKPYEEINVSDAQVMIRPEMYRKLRMSLGEWSFEEDEDGYSDEKAYKILETDASWMYDPEKYKLVSKLQVLPLKMTYFANGSRVISVGKNEKVNYQNVPVYNKMAIFPLFKYAAASATGSVLYERMNRKGQEIDMISFESAVKVGLPQKIYKPFEYQTTDLGILNPEIGNDELNVQTQKISGLRLQLNTEAHEDESRAIGTLMFKIALSEILDDEDYGLNQGDYEGKTAPTRKGKKVKYELIHAINALTYKGAIRLRYKYYNETGGRNYSKIEQKIRKIVENQDLGIQAEDILRKGTPASLMSRTVFEQGFSKEVNKLVVDILTKGGSAIQQSIFGFVGYGKNNLISQEDLKENQQFNNLNNGEDLKWIAKNNSMEVILSLNFFRSVVPQEYQDTPARMRQWLIDHDVIKGVKTDGTLSKPTPYGVGYRIPTQGKSSMFAFIVADVLPEQAGDVIVLPKEITAQTGSDYDVKLY